jgi:hypothetical protein
MSQLRIGAIGALIALGIPTVMAVATGGNNAFPDAITYNLTSLQIWVDLVIGMLFWIVWLLQDARANGRNPWGWLIASLIVGSFSPLLYLLVYERWKASPLERTEPANRTMGRVIGGIVTLAFTGLTVAALMNDGTDVPATVMHSWANFQIWLDLVIIIVFWIFWMIKDAQAAGRNPWGWVVLALIAGSFSPLLYLIVYGRWPGSDTVAANNPSGDTA